MDKNLDKNDFKHYSKNGNNFSSTDTYGVIGVCGVVGNLVARVLMDNDFKVKGTDNKKEEECKFKYTLKDYNLPLYFGEHPESFFNGLNYIIPPPSLSKSSDLFKRLIDKANYGKFKVIDVDEIIESIDPGKPVLCITGTNGKTTTTALLKYICTYASLKPTEHGFKELQGNIDYIPPLQCRLQGDVAILETGTFGNPGDLKFIMERCQPSCGIITNITPDHMHRIQDFLNYASIKGEFVEYLHDQLIIANTDDPTIWGLINSNTYSDKNNPISEHLITFGVDQETNITGKKTCWCGKEISIRETISGMGYYRCTCGLERIKPQYLATEIKEKSFTLHTPDDVVQVKMSLMGLHNVYNTIGAIAAAKEFFKIPLNQIIAAVESFKGVAGRLDYIGQWQGKDIIIDYAHNPGGVETVLRELKKVYEQVAVVITVSSESGDEGDVDILKKCLDIADYVIPASFYSRKAADKFMEAKSELSHENIEQLHLKKIILPSQYPEEFKKGTLGASLKQMEDGLSKALQIDVSAVVCIGEAAFKYKENITEFMESMLR